MRRVLTGTILLVVGLVALRELEPLVLFRPVHAEVLTAEVVNHSMRVGPRPGRRSGMHRTRSGYVPEVTYRYNVDGVTYASAQYSRIGTLEPRRKASRRIRGMVSRASVTAWYSPWNPSEAVLSRAPNLIWLAILAVVLFFLWLIALADKATRLARFRIETGSPSGRGEPPRS